LIKVKQREINLFAVLLSSDRFSLHNGSEDENNSFKGNLYRIQKTRSIYREMDTTLICLSIILALIYFYLVRKPANFPPGNLLELV